MTKRDIPPSALAAAHRLADRYYTVWSAWHPGVSIQPFDIQVLSVDDEYEFIHMMGGTPERPSNIVVQPHAGGWAVMYEQWGYSIQGFSLDGPGEACDAALAAAELADPGNRWSSSPNPGLLEAGVA